MMNKTLLYLYLALDDDDDHTNQNPHYPVYRCYQLNSITKFYKYFNTFFFCARTSCSRALYSFLLYVDVLTYFFATATATAGVSFESERREMRCNTMCQSEVFFLPLCPFSLAAFFFALSLVADEIVPHIHVLHGKQYHWTYFSLLGFCCCHVC